MLYQVASPSVATAPAYSDLKEDKVMIEGIVPHV